ncbi:17598_t:CDS:2, partial [Funneliformis geosporum]
TQKSKELRNEIFDENAPIRNVGGDDSDDGDQMFKNSTYEVIRQAQRAFPDEEDFETTFEDKNNNNEHPNALNVENEHDKSTPSTSSRRQRNNRVVNGLKVRYVTNYPFDYENGMAKSASKKAVIHEIHGISKCYPIENETHDDASKIVATEGVNFYNIWKYDNIIDLNNIYSNDIAVILNTYGVKAARAAILKETFEGKYKPFNRIGLDTSTSPLLKMSFESTCSFLTQATLHGDTDLLDSPSARLVLGKVIQGGTGSFEVRVPFESIPKYLKT